MNSKVYLTGAYVAAFLVVYVDFASHALSVLVDGLLMLALGALLYLHSRGKA